MVLVQLVLRVHKVMAVLETVNPEQLDFGKLDISGILVVQS